MKSKAIFGLLGLAIVALGMAAMTAQQVQAGNKKDNNGTYQPVWCKLTGNGWKAQLAANGNGKDGALFMTQAILDENLSVVQPGTAIGKQVYAHDRSDKLDGFCQTQSLGRAVASVGVIDPTCDNMVGGATFAVQNANLTSNNGNLIQTAGAHTATFTAKDGYLFANGQSTYSVEYVVYPSLSAEDCEEESTPAAIEAVVKCATYQDQAKIELTLTNSGETAGEVSVNGEIVNVPAKSSVVNYFDSKTNVKVVDGEEVILDQTLDCTPGQGGGGTTPETPKTPETPETPKTTETPQTPKTLEAPESPKSPESPIVLPNTFGASTPLVSAGALSFASLILVAGTAIKSRLLA